MQWLYTVGLAGILTILPVGAATPTQEDLQVFIQLAQLPRAQSQQAWQNALGILEQVTEKKRIPQETVINLVRQQRLIERAELEIRAIPTPETMQPWQAKLVEAYHLQNEALDLIFQLLVSGGLSSTEQIRLTEAVQKSTTLLQEVNAALEPRP